MRDSGEPGSSGAGTGPASAGADEAKRIVSHRQSAPADEAPAASDQDAAEPTRRIVDTAEFGATSTSAAEPRSTGQRNDHPRTTAWRVGDGCVAPMSPGDRPNDRQAKARAARIAGAALVEAYEAFEHELA